MKKRVLIVDDDDSVRESLKKVLQDSGYEVVLALDGQQAMGRLDPGPMDVLLLDLNLPDRSGWDVYESLTTRYPLVPIVIITGMPNQHPVALAAGADALFEKPVEVSQLLDTLAGLLTQPREARLQRLCGYRDDMVFAAPTGVLRRNNGTVGVRRRPACSRPSASAGSQ